MSREDVFTCDRCGKTIGDDGICVDFRDGKRKKPRFKIFRRAGMKSIVWYCIADLCGGCAKSLEEWFKDVNPCS